MPYELRIESVEFYIKALENPYCEINESYLDLFVNQFQYIEPDQMNELLKLSWTIIKRYSLTSFYAGVLSVHKKCLENGYSEEEILAGIVNTPNIKKELLKSYMDYLRSHSSAKKIFDVYEAIHEALSPINK